MQEDRPEAIKAQSARPAGPSRLNHACSSSWSARAGVAVRDPAKDESDSKGAFPSAATPDGTSGYTCLPFMSGRSPLEVS